ncbi:Serine/threonine protein kinase [Acidobacteriia bacterium SbA2]|nr:Serine/threonine protein kinase [Acidobacteriia bacterium SbA2]
MTPERWQQVKGVLESVLELAPAERAAILDQACDGDQALRQEVETLLAADDEIPPEKKLDSKLLNEVALAVSDAATTPHHADAWIGRRVGPYNIVEQVGAGGMGEVYRAVRDDEHYRKQVAIKVVRAGQDSALVVSRFRNERQILAGLDHPNIARLLDGGTTKEGAAYFVMELIDGQPIDEYCKQHKVEVAERLKLFLQVCSAVQYAHQRLIIHRDIKPGNILVTSEGMPKLLDFGIAKLLDANAEGGQPEPTLTIFRILTPAYASPEQVKGEPITTASDVYSLGVVLYQLLTGSSPYHLISRTPQEIVHAVCELEPERPSTALRRMVAESKERAAQKFQAPTNGAHDGSLRKRSKRLSGDLDNIVLMALRKEPQRRYASVEQFAEDIRRHLENLPVVARKDTIRYRASKFVTRHRAGVIAAALVTLTLLVGLAVTIREARVAQQRFNEVRSLANSLIFDIHDSIQDLPGATPARKLIVEKALQYLDSLARASKGDPSLQRELAAAYKRIGDVQGYPYSANLGDTAGARRSYEKALAIRQTLYSSYPENIDDALGLAESSRLLGDVLMVNDDTKAALEYVQRAVQVGEQADRTHPDNVKVLQELTKDYESKADLLAGNFNTTSLGDNASALALRRKELAMEERLLALAPDDLTVKRDVGARVAKMGDQLLLDGQWREALPYYVQAQKVMEDLANRSQTTKTLEYLDSMYSRVQEVDVWSGDFRHALTINLRALEISKRLSSADPHSTKARLGLTVDWSNVADSASRLGQRGQAVSAINQGRSLIGELVRLDPKNTEFQGVQAAVHVTAGDVFRRSGDVSQALHYYREALSLTSQMQAADPNNVDGRLRLAAISNSVGEMLTRSRDLKGASEILSKALELAKPEATSSHPNEQALYSTADSYTGLAEVEATLAADTGLARGKRMKHWTQASSLAERSLKTWAQVKEPGIISPDGFDCIPPSVVEERFARYKTALTSGQAGGQG